MRCLIIAPYPEGTAPSSRFRYEQFLPGLRSMGWVVEIAPFFDAPGYRSIKCGGFGTRVAAMAIGLWRRLFLVLAPPQSEVVLLHREAVPVASGAIEWILRRIHRRRIVYDFDDAIWLGGPGVSPLRHKLRTGGKTERLIAMSDVVLAGNAYLAAHAARHARDVRVVPTVVDTETRFTGLHVHRPGRATIAWTGSASSFRYLEGMATVLRRVEADRPVSFLVISDVFADLGVRDVEEVAWSESTEVEVLRRADIGLMPLPDDAWTRGKCGFKIIQYMALGIVPVASPVGANCEIVEHGVDGFLCDTDDAWHETLLRLIDDAELRARMGAAARRTAVERYSVASQLPRLDEALRDAAGRG